MNREEFIKYIEYIGFKIYKDNDIRYDYKGFRIYAHNSFYSIYHDYSSNSITFDFDDLKPIENYFKKELRSIKLKSILG